MHLSISWLKVKIKFLLYFLHKQIGLSETLGSGLQ